MSTHTISSLARLICAWRLRVHGTTNEQLQAPSLVESLSGPTNGYQALVANPLPPESKQSARFLWSVGGREQRLLSMHQDGTPIKQGGCTAARRWLHSGESL